MIWVGLRSFLLSLEVWEQDLIKIACSSKENNEHATMRAHLGIWRGTTETWRQLKKKKKKITAAVQRHDIAELLVPFCLQVAFAFVFSSK